MPHKISKISTMIFLPTPNLFYFIFVIFYFILGSNTKIGLRQLPISLQCLRLKFCKRLEIVSVVKKKKSGFTRPKNMVDPSRNENEGYKAHSEGNGKIELESALPKD